MEAGPSCFEASAMLQYFKEMVVQSLRAQRGLYAEGDSLIDWDIKKRERKFRCEGGVLRG